MKTGRTIATLLGISILAVGVLANGKLNRNYTKSTYNCSGCTLVNGSPTGSCTNVATDTCACDAACPDNAWCSCTESSGSCPTKTYTGTCTMYVGRTFRDECGPQANCQGTSPWPGSPTIWACVICDTTGSLATLGTGSGTICQAYVVYGG
jgi:hypothetical protein